MKARSVIFDLDGTLVDSLDDIAAALNHVLAAQGMPTHSRAAVEGFIGEGARVLVERAVPPGADVDATLAAFRARYAANLVVHTRAYDGVAPLLSELARRGVPTAVLSNKPHDLTVGVVGALFEGHRFVRVLGQREGVPRKPDPTAANELGAALEAPIAFVGDTPIDVATAKAAGMIAIGVAWGMRDVALLRDADAVLQQPSELLAWLDSA